MYAAAMEYMYMGKRTYMPAFVWKAGVNSSDGTAHWQADNGEADIIFIHYTARPRIRATHCCVVSRCSRMQRCVRREHILSGTTAS
jgi:hypothetical protein